MGYWVSRQECSETVRPRNGVHEKEETIDAVLLIQGREGRVVLLLGPDDGL